MLAPKIVGADSRCVSAGRRGGPMIVECRRWRPRMMLSNASPNGGKGRVVGEQNCWGVDTKPRRVINPRGGSPKGEIFRGRGDLRRGCMTSQALYCGKRGVTPQVLKLARR